MQDMKGLITDIDNNESGRKILGEDGKFYSFCDDDFAIDDIVSFEADADEIKNVHLTISDDDEEIKAIKDYLRDNLSEKRYSHSLRVAMIAKAIAKNNDSDFKKAEMIGLLHDVAKEMEKDDQIALIRKENIPIASYELEYHHMLHAYAGSVLVKDILHIDDEEIVEGIRYHSGRPEMNMLEKIIFLADHIDKSYKIGFDTNDIVNEKNIDDAIMKIIMFIDAYYVSKRLEPDTATEMVMNYMLIKRNKKIEEEKSLISDEMFDVALRINARKSLKLSSVSNDRDIYGYSCFNRRKIRRGVICRSAMLDRLTKEDGNRLKQFGIDTIIDLRSAEEIAEHPDQNIDDLTYVNCPLKTIELNEYQKNVAEKYSISSGKEKAYYLLEYASTISMEDMYAEVLNDPVSIEGLKKIFETLLEENANGVLIHCVSGKDRTGIAIALIMLALKADLKDIVNEYYASCISSFGSAETMAQNLRYQGFGSVFTDELRYYMSIGSDMIEKAFDDLENRYGSLENYLKDAIGLDQERIRKLRNKYLENFIEIKPDIEEMYDVEDYVYDVIKDRASMKIVNKINLCIDELFSNIVKYGMCKQIDVRCFIQSDRVIIEMKDDGMAFDPLSIEEPNIDDAGRKPGGLGIFVIRNYADDVSYERLEDRNIFRMMFDLGELS